MAKQRGIYWTGHAPATLPDGERGRWDGITGAVGDADDAPTASKAYLDGLEAGMREREAAHNRLSEAVERMREMVERWAVAPTYMGQTVDAA